MLSAILSALSVVLIFLSSMTFLDLTLVMIASFAIVFAVIELNSKYPLLIYSVTSVLSLLIVPNRSTALFYVIIFGYYPMMKAIFERMHYIVAWVLKLSTFNTSVILMIVFSKYILHLDDIGIEYDIIVLLLANITFVLYDFLITRLTILYFVKLRTRFKIGNYFED